MRRSRRPCPMCQPEQKRPRVESVLREDPRDPSGSDPLWVFVGFSLASIVLTFILAVGVGVLPTVRRVWEGVPSIAVALPW